MSQENVEIVKRAIAAFNRRDLAALEAMYAPDVEWQDLDHAPDAPEVVHGIAAVKRIWADWLAVFDEFRCDVSEYVDAGDWVVTVARWHGSGAGSGVTVDLHQVDATRLQGGQVVRVVLAYGSKAEALAAVGLSE